MKKKLSALARADEVVYRFERALTGVILLAMSAVVFVDVVHRVFSRSPGRLSVYLSRLTGASPESLDVVVNPAIVLAVVLALAYGAFKTRGPGPALAKAVGATVTLAAAVTFFVRLVPQGVVWAPYFGLSGLLWIGLIGASMATHTGQHLQLEMGEKIWPEKVLPYVRLVCRVIVAAFAGMIAVLGALSVRDHFNDWQSGPGAGLLPSIDWPKWMVFVVIPYSFGMIALRYLGRATGLLPEPPAQEIA